MGTRRVPVGNAGWRWRSLQWAALPAWPLPPRIGPMKYALRLRLFAFVLLLVFLSSPTAAYAQEPKATQEAITRLLQDFLTHNDDPAQHDRFWAADLVYTGSKGVVRSKAEIMKMVAASPSDPAEPKETY